MQAVVGACWGLGKCKSVVPFCKEGSGVCCRVIGCVKRGWVHAERCPEHFMNT